MNATERQIKNAQALQKFLSDQGITLDKHSRWDAHKFKSPGYMDLNIDLLYVRADHARIALSHYGMQNGDKMADPDMELVLHFETESVPARLKARTWQNDYLGIYRDAEGNSALEYELDGFVTMWLSNIKQQGHSVVSA